MYHEIELIGNLGQDPEMRYVGETPVTNLSLATNKKWTGADGQKHEQVVWWRVSVWGKQAEACQQYLTKGRQVFIKAEMQPGDGGNPRTFQLKDGSWGASYEVRANKVLFLGSKGERVGANDVQSADDLPF
jgi:single-strand DNA-binding protein